MGRGERSTVDASEREYSGSEGLQREFTREEINKCVPTILPFCARNLAVLPCLALLLACPVPLSSLPTSASPRDQSLDLFY